MVPSGAASSSEIIAQVNHFDACVVSTTRKYIRKGRHQNWNREADAASWPVASASTDRSSIFMTVYMSVLVLSKFRLTYSSAQDTES